MSRNRKKIKMEKLIKRKLEEFKMVGIVGPYYGNGVWDVIEENVLGAESVAIALANLGIPFYCAHLHTRHFETKAHASEEFYKRQDMYLLTTACSAILVLPGWKTSSGTLAEIAEFERLGRRIFYVEKDCLKEVKKWAKEK